jgi:hypothetical protein
VLFPTLFIITGSVFDGKCSVGKDIASDTAYLDLALGFGTLALGFSCPKRKARYRFHCQRVASARMNGFSASAGLRHHDVSALSVRPLWDVLRLWKNHRRNIC